MVNLSKEQSIRFHYIVTLSIDHYGMVYEQKETFLDKKLPMS